MVAKVLWVFTILKAPTYLVVDMITADRNRVHDILSAMVIIWCTESYVVRIMFSSKVVAELVGCYKICFLEIRQYITVPPVKN